MTRLTHAHDSLSEEQSARPGTKIDPPSPRDFDGGGDPTGHHQPDLRVAGDGSSALWQAYSRRRDGRQRDRVVLQYEPLVRRVAGRIGAALATHVEFADLVQYGVFGLIEAVERAEQRLESELSRRATKAELVAELRLTSAEPRIALGQIHLIGIDQLDKGVPCTHGAVTRPRSSRTRPRPIRWRSSWSRSCGVRLPRRSAASPSATAASYRCSTSTS